jgi:hypothetical protein
VRHAGSVDPGLVVEAGRLDNQRVAFPVAYGFAVPQVFRELREFAAVQKDLPPGVRAAFI